VQRDCPIVRQAQPVGQDARQHAQRRHIAHGVDKRHGRVAAHAVHDVGLHGRNALPWLGAAEVSQPGIPDRLRRLDKDPLPSCQLIGADGAGRQRAAVPAVGRDAPAGVLHPVHQGS
jgi:hypothetical protein